VRASRWATIAVTTAVGLLGGPAQAASGAQHAVTMTFAISPGDPNAHQTAETSTPYGSLITLTGRADYGSHGNAGTVDVYFTTYYYDPHEPTRLVLSLRAGDDGSFRKTIRATENGTYKAVYRGNAVRKTATRSARISVYYEDASPVMFYTGSNACPTTAGSRCIFISATLNNPERAPIRVNWVAACSAGRYSSGGAYRGADQVLAVGYTRATTSTDAGPYPKVDENDRESILASEAFPESAGWTYGHMGWLQGTRAIAANMTDGHVSVVLAPGCSATVILTTRIVSRSTVDWNIFTPPLI
jgi:hypothetical protein